MSVPMKLVARVIAAPLLLVSLGVLAQPAAADPPTHFPLEANVYNFDAGVVCAFPMQATEVLQGAMVTLFADGSAHVTGNYVLQLRNVDNGRALSIHAPGPILVPATGPSVGPGQQVFML